MKSFDEEVFRSTFFWTRDVDVRVSVLIYAFFRLQRFSGIRRAFFPRLHLFLSWNLIRLSSSRSESYKKRWEIVYRIRSQFSAKSVS